MVNVVGKQGLARENVFLFYPNVIGYVRIVAAVVSIYFMPTFPLLTITCYLFSRFLDAIDGNVARFFNQSTRLGAMLDLLTDCCGLLGIIMGLMVIYPDQAFLLQMSAIIDIAGHWMYMSTSHICGKTSHKEVQDIDNPVLKLYYTSRAFLCAMVVGNEIFYSCLYLLHFYPEILLWKCLAWLSFPVALGKTLITICHMLTAASKLANLDVKERQQQRLDKEDEKSA